MKIPRSRLIRLALAVAVFAVAAALVFFFAAERDEAGDAPDAVGPLEPLEVERPAPDALRELDPDVLRLLDPATPRRLRIDLAMALPPDLGEAELEALLAEVSAPPPVGVDLPWHSQYFHEICRRLRREEALRRRFARVLAAVATDAGRSRVERDYSVQHLRGVWHGAGDDAELRRSVRLRFEALVSGGPDVAGPAILALHSLGNEPATRWTAADAAVGDGEIAPLVGDILRRGPEELGAASVMAALRVAGERELAAAAPRIRAIAENPAAVLPLRLLAVSVLARSGEESGNFLRSIDRRDPRVDRAVRLALGEPS